MTGPLISGNPVGFAAGWNTTLRGSKETFFLAFVEARPGGLGHTPTTEIMLDHPEPDRGTPASFRSGKNQVRILN